jgi:hypothetical protein
LIAFRGTGGTDKTSLVVASLHVCALWYSSQCNVDDDRGWMTVSGCSHVLSFQQVGQLSTVKTCVKHVLFLFDLTIDKATHPTNRQEDWEYIIGFCDQINKELEGYVIS